MLRRASSDPMELGHRAALLRAPVRALAALLHGMSPARITVYEKQGEKRYVFQLVQQIHTSTEPHC